MGLVKIISRLLTAWVAFLHPCFASYKALSHRPVSEPDLERWVKYWSIVGALVGLEYALEWLVSWVPFYWEIKTIFVLYLALPQTQGSTFIYDSYLAPYFIRNEASIDASIVTAQSSMVVFLQERLRALWALAWKFAGQVQAQASQPQTASGAQSAPGTGSPAEVVSNLWKAYGPSLVAGLANASPAPQPDRNVTPQSQSTPPVSMPAAPPYTRSPFSTSGEE
ncbi:TB2/DP1, HVA22 family-domain-containing protein [Gautieria morchelliformis]|nr:TB2/DP1, HVA22 family-domain-containing protein [Gautieria morchelliformis]